MTSSFPHYVYCGFPLEHPIFASGGCAQTLEDVRVLARSTSSMVEVGSVILSKSGRPGNAGQTYWSDQRTISFNVRNIPCPSEDYYRQNLHEMVEMAHRFRKILVWNIAGQNPVDFACAVRLGVQSGVDVIVVNAGCTNLWSDHKQKPTISHNSISLSAVLMAVQDALSSSRTPIDLKISPVENIQQREKNAQMIFNLVLRFPCVKLFTLINTIPNKVGFDERGFPCINSSDVPGGFGGMGGAITKPLGMWYVVRFASLISQNSALAQHVFTIRACGGVTCGKDVVDYLRAGRGHVCAVGVGTTVHDYGVRALSDILEEFTSSS
ncbi:MAG: hypothetical protein KC736_02100 [Candidatus Moranbacteria bacterium]|nr:hypothetical protein [Candidatus Moranbacteria bacterium]